MVYRVINDGAYWFARPGTDGQNVSPMRFANYLRPGDASPAPSEPFITWGRDELTNCSRAVDTVPDDDNLLDNGSHIRVTLDAGAALAAIGTTPSRGQQYLPTTPDTGSGYLRFRAQGFNPADTPRIRLILRLWELDSTGTPFFTNTLNFESGWKALENDVIDFIQILSVPAATPGNDYGDLTLSIEVDTQGTFSGGETIDILNASAIGELNGQALAGFRPSAAYDRSKFVCEWEGAFLDGSSDIILWTNIAGNFSPFELQYLTASNELRLRHVSGITQMDVFCPVADPQNVHRYRFERTFIDDITFDTLVFVDDVQQGGPQQITIPVTAGGLNETFWWLYSPGYLGEAEPAIPPGSPPVGFPANLEFLRFSWGQTKDGPFTFLCDSLAPFDFGRP